MEPDISKEQQKANRHKFAKRLRWAERSQIAQGFGRYYDGRGCYCAIGVELYFGRGEFLNRDDLKPIADQLEEAFGIPYGWFIEQNDTKMYPFRVIAENMELY